MKAACGYESTSGLYYEVLGEQSADRPPFLFIHGGGASGACFRVTPDGRPGWADRLAAGGAEVWVTDWPGCGRSGGRDPLAVGYDDLVDGFAALLEGVIGRSAIVLCHSMGGAITWKLVERDRSFVESVVALAASHPGNIAPVSEVISDDGVTVCARFAASGVEFEVRRDRAYHYSGAYVLGQAIAGSTRFPRDHVQEFRGGLLGIPPLVILQRLGLEGGLPCVTRTARFEGLRVRFVTGAEDPAHTRAIEQATTDLLRSWGADAEVAFLDEHGIDGNGHFFFIEENSDEIFDFVTGWALA